MDILEKIAVRNVTQNVQAVIFTVAYAILDVNEDGKERTVLKVLFFVKKKSKNKNTFYVVSGLFPVLSIFIAFLFCQLSQTKLLKLFRKMALPFIQTLWYLVYNINKTMF